MDGYRAGGSKGVKEGSEGITVAYILLLSHSGAHIMTQVATFKQTDIGGNRTQRGLLGSSQISAHKQQTCIFEI